MITPHLNIVELTNGSANGSAHGSDSEANNRLLNSARHWSLFGSLMISARIDQIDATKNIIRQLGDIDIDVWIPGIEPETALELLNHGAAKIITQESNFLALANALPADRICKTVAEIMPADPIDADTEVLFTVQSGPLKEATGGDSEIRNYSEFENPVAYFFERDVSSETIIQTIADGIRCIVDVKQLDADSKLLAGIIMARVKSDRPDGLIPTLIVDPIGTALGLAYSNSASVEHALATRNGTYWSRSRDQLWEKGATSGATQKLLRIDTDCDHDCLRFTVQQDPPGFCHKNTYTCFGEQRSIQSVIHRLQERIKGTDTKSFTYKLANDSNMLETKLLEEAQELSDAVAQDEVTWEAADVFYFSLVKMVQQDVSLDRVFAELARRMNRVVRRKNKLEEK